MASFVPNNDHQSPSQSWSGSVSAVTNMRVSAREKGDLYAFCAAEINYAHVAESARSNRSWLEQLGRMPKLQTVAKTSCYPI